MDRKGSKNSLTRPSRSKKRRFRGNQYSVENDTSFTSASAEKLRKTGEDEIHINKEHGYCILNFYTVFTAISSIVVCKDCKNEIRFSETSSRGLGFKIAVVCDCGIRYINSCPFVDKAFEINRRIVAAMRLLGIGRQGINLFCGIMDIGQGLAINIYYSCLENLHCAAQAVYESVLKKAIEEEKVKNVENKNPLLDLSVSGGGTWKKRGFSSLFGVTTLIGKYSNKVVDSVIKSSYCQACNLWKTKADTNEYQDWLKSHEAECSINLDGSADKMEIDAVNDMFLRSIEKHGVRYMSYIGDGNCKNFKAVFETGPYGIENIVKKKECVFHLKKRMGRRLRDATEKNNNIDGNVSRTLTNEIISELETYYDLAIKRHSDSVQEMRNAVWATFYHKSSTDENPQHTHCPPGNESWCKWRRAEASGTLDKFTHDEPPLDDTALKAIEPIYKDFTSDELLERCLEANTQNDTESLNSLIWTFAPKHSGPAIVELATYLAVCIFNEGFDSILQILKTMGITIGQQTNIFADIRNEERIEQFHKRALDNSKKMRNNCSKERSVELDFFEKEEGAIYGS